MFKSDPLDYIFGRRSIRVFKPGKIGQETLEVLLKAAMAAPSACAKDPWHFIVVQSLETLGLLADALPNGQMLSSAAAGIVVCGDLQEAHDHQLSYMLQDCSAATENLLLAAHGLGLGGCWLGIHPRTDRIQKVTAILGLPTHIVPVSCVALGLPGETKEPRNRYQAAHVHQAKW
jgi:nitroreductase